MVMHRRQGSQKREPPYSGTLGLTATPLRVAAGTAGMPVVLTKDPTDMGLTCG